MIFTKEKLSTYLMKTIKKYNNLTIINYLHKTFILEINKGPLCSKHTILSPEEARQVCFDIKSHGHRLPAITVDDPQNIWIGGAVNDIIKIESNSEITGKTVRYRIVTNSLGKISEKREITKITIPGKEDPEEKKIDDDEYEIEENDYIDD